MSKPEMVLGSKYYFPWVQLLLVMPNLLKENLKEFPINTDIFLCNDHYIKRKSRMLTLEKLTAKEIYMILSTVLS